MAALTKERDTAFVAHESIPYIPMPVAAGVTIYMGALVGISATGFATPGAVSASLLQGGVARETVDNAGGGDGDVTVEAWGSIVWVENGTGGDEITLAHISLPCYYLDDQTVSFDSAISTRSVAGTILDVSATDGVMIRTRS